MNDLRLQPMTFEEAKQILEMEIDWDWEKFRREAAKDILCALLGRVERFYTGVSVNEKKIFDHKDFIKLAIEDADELIRRLKEK